MKLDKLDVLFSEFIRKRAIQRVHGCERCGAGKTDYKQLQCSHFMGRNKRTVRYDEDNACGLCAGCHMYLTSQPLEHIEFMRKMLGDKLIPLLMARSRPQKIDKQAVELYLKEQVRMLDEQEEKQPTSRG